MMRSSYVLSDSGMYGVALGRCMSPVCSHSQTISKNRAERERRMLVLCPTEGRPGRVRKYKNPRPSDGRAIEGVTSPWRFAGAERWFPEQTGEVGKAGQATDGEGQGMAASRPEQISKFRLSRFLGSLCRFGQH